MLKNKILKSITGLNFALFLIAGCALDSDSWIPFIVVLVTGGWLILFMYANGWFEECRGQGKERTMLRKKVMEDKPVIYAVDFDGTLCENKWPEIGKPNIMLIEFLKSEQKAGNKVILWTMRERGFLEDAQEWLYSNFEFEPDAVNDNLPEMQAVYGNNPRKVYANVYIDDHNAKFGVCAKLPFVPDLRAW